MIFIWIVNFIVTLCVSWYAAFIAEPAIPCWFADIDLFVRLWPANAGVLATIQRLSLTRIDGCKVVFSNSIVSSVGIFAIIAAVFVCLRMPKQKTDHPSYNDSDKQRNLIGTIILIGVAIYTVAPSGMTSISETKVRKGLDISSTTTTVVFYSAAWIHFFYVLLFCMLLVFRRISRLL
jgi:predicted peroxiredoxin